MVDEGATADDENDSRLDAALSSAVEIIEWLRDEARRAFSAGESGVDAAAVAEASISALDALEEVRFRLIVRPTDDGSDGS